MKENLKLNNQGFSLVELLMTMAISGIVISSIYSFAIFGTKSYNDANLKAEIQSEVQITTNILAETFMEASAKAISIDGLDEFDRIMHGYIAINTGKSTMIFCQEAQSLLLYPNGETIDYAGILNDIDTDSVQSHLVSKRVTSFMPVLDPDLGTIKVSITFDILGNETTVTSTYKFRNS